MGLKLGTTPPDLGTAGLLEGATGEGDPAGGNGASSPLRRWLPRDVHGTPASRAVRVCSVLQPHH